MIRCAIEGRYFAPLRRLWAVALAGAAIGCSRRSIIFTPLRITNASEDRRPGHGGRRREELRPSTWEEASPVIWPGEAINSLAVAAVGAGPDEAVALAFLVGEEVGVDRSGEARVV